MILGNIQKIIIGIFSVLLIILFITLIWTFSEAQKNSEWPPTIQNCPDYWMETATGCKPSKTIGKCDVKTAIHFETADYCNKYKWSIGDVSSTYTPCGGNVPWDGINYGYGQFNPCNENYNPQSI